MNTISFTHKNKNYNYQAPRKWNEVTVRQLLMWVGVLHAKVDEETKLAMAVPVFYGLKPKLFAALKLSQRLQIAPTLRPLMDANKLDVWLIEHFRLRFRKYYGPADKLSNLTAHEFFKVCEPLYWRYKETGTEDYLNALCAALYRPKRKGLVDDDIRQEITDAGIALRSQRFKRLSLTFKLAILFNYEGCRNFIARTHPKAFKQSGNGDKKGGDVTLALAGGALGDHEKTKRTNLYTFLEHLVNLITQQEELERK